MKGQISDFYQWRIKKSQADVRIIQIIGLAFNMVFNETGLIDIMLLCVILSKFRKNWKTLWENWHTPVYLLHNDVGSMIQSYGDMTQLYLHKIKQFTVKCKRNSHWNACVSTISLASHCNCKVFMLNCKHFIWNESTSFITTWE